jgi:hypothetical protein
MYKNLIMLKEMKDTHGWRRSPVGCAPHTILPLSWVFASGSAAARGATGSLPASAAVSLPGHRQSVAVRSPAASAAAVFVVVYVPCAVVVVLDPRHPTPDTRSPHFRHPAHGGADPQNRISHSPAGAPTGGLRPGRSLAAHRSSLAAAFAVAVPEPRTRIPKPRRRRYSSLVTHHLSLPFYLVSRCHSSSPEKEIYRANRDACTEESMQRGCPCGTAPALPDTVILLLAVTGRCPG